MLFVFLWRSFRFFSFFAKCASKPCKYADGNEGKLPTPPEPALQHVVRQLRKMKQLLRLALEDVVAYALKALKLAVT